MGLGVFLMVVGAILALAVDDEMPNVNLKVVGVILFVAGAGIIAHARRGKVRERVITRRDGTAPGKGPQVVEEVVRERDRD